MKTRNITNTPKEVASRIIHFAEEAGKAISTGNEDTALDILTRRIPRLISRITIDVTK